MGGRRFRFSSFFLSSFAGVIAWGRRGAVTFARIAFPVLFCALFLFRALAGGVLDEKKDGRPFRAVFIVLGVLVVWKIVATIFNGASVFYALDDAVFSFGVFCFFYVISGRALLRDVIKVLCLAGIITFFIVVFEYSISHPLHYGLVNSALFEEDALVGKVRDGVYRVQGVFDNPLSLAEFLVYLSPVFAYRIAIGKGVVRGAFVFWMLLLILSLWMTGSRGGILVFSAGICAFTLFYGWSGFTRYTRTFLAFLIFSFFVAAVFSVYGFIYELGLKAQTVSFVRFDETERSTYSRALQYFEVFSLLQERPIFGLGVHQNFAKGFEEIHRIDNFYLRVGLEGGVVGILLFISFLVVLFKRLYRQGRVCVDGEGRAFFSLSLSLVLVFAMMKLFLSMPTNNIYFYALMGLVLGYYARVRQFESGASSACTPRP